MPLKVAKCKNCGASIRVDSKQNIGVCNHCGTSYINEEVNINNVTNINYTEVVDGTKINRSAVLEKLLIEYYSGRFDDIDNIKEYALKVQEVDLGNVLANFVVFDNIDNSVSVKKILSNLKLSIGFELFMKLLNLSAEYNNKNIIQNILKYKAQVGETTIATELLNAINNKDWTFILTIINELKLSEESNNQILDNLYNDDRTNKITFLRNLKLFAGKHKEFMFDKAKYDELTKHWINLKEKQIQLRQQVAEEEKSSLKAEVKREFRRKNNIKIGIAILGFIILLVGLILLIVMQ